MPKENQHAACDPECRGVRIALAMSLLSWAVFILAWLWSPLAVNANEKLVATPSLEIELNSLAETTAGGCRINFMLHNVMPNSIEDLAFEVALFDKDGRVANLLRMGIGALQKAKTRIRQFDLKNTQCSNISRILINEITACKGEGLTPRICLKALNATSRTKVAFGL